MQMAVIIKRGGSWSNGVWLSAWQKVIGLVSNAVRMMRREAPP